MVKGLRQNQGKEGDYVSLCLADIRAELRQSDASIKASALLKLSYLTMIGYDMDMGLAVTVEVMACAKFTVRRSAYLAAALAFTADTTNGGYVQRVRFRTLGTNANATAARIWVNNGATTATAANNTLIDEITLPTTTVSQVAAQSNYELPLNFALPAGYRVYITVATAPTSAGWNATVIGGKY